MYKLTYPSPPTFDSLEEERLHRKQHLVAGFRLFNRFGFSEGVAGHITARDPEFPDRFWVNPYGTHFGRMTVSDLICVDHHGELVEGSLSGSNIINQAAFAIHSAVHAARPDVVAAAHAHSLYGKTWSAYGQLLDPLTQDACIFYEDHALFDDFTGVVLDPDEGKRLAHELGECKAIILKNHGLLTVGHTVDEAVWLFTTMERTCQSQLLTLGAGKPDPIPHEVAQLTESQVGGHDIGWFSAQPMFKKIFHDEPDLLE